MAEYNYAALASTIKIEDITSDEHNQTILQRLRDNDTSLHKLLICKNIGIFGDQDISDCYAPDDVEELGWLGFYIGQNTMLQKLHFYDNQTNMFDSERPFFEGLRCNKSIQEIHVDGLDMSEGRSFSMMVPFFKSNDSLSKIQIGNCEFGEEGARQLSLAIGNCGKSLKVLRMANDEENFESGQVVYIITALSMHPQLEELRLSDVNFGRNESIALSTLLRCTATKLRTIDLNGSDIDDEGIECIVNALANINTLRELDLGYNNQRITIKGWKAVSTLLEMPGSNLEKLDIGGCDNFGNDGALVFANALVNNSTLKTFNLTDCGITAEGWAPFLKLLCNTSSVNNTYMSNHTLQSISGILGLPNAVPIEVERDLLLNEETPDKGKVAIIKILRNRSHFDMEPFFEWELKVLPIMVNWFTKASTCTDAAIWTNDEFEEKINKMKLSIVYDFIREFPMLYIEPMTRKEIAEYTATEEQLQGKPMWQEKLGEIRAYKARAMMRLL